MDRTGPLASIVIVLLFRMVVLSHAQSAACAISGDYLNGSTAFFSSPNFPNSYPPYSRCVWNITVPSGYIIKLSFLHFELDSYPYSDRVTITNVASDDGHHPFQLYGQRLPSPVYSMGNSVQVVFTSVNNQYSGFNATYKAITYDSECPNMANLNKTSGVITSPFYPRKYRDNQRCGWQIKASKGKRIKLVIETMYIEWGGTNCPYDYLQIENGSLFDSGVLYGRMCGRGITNATFFSFRDTLIVRFSTDGSGRYRGFNMTYTQLHFSGTADTCTTGGFLTGISGFFSSPDFPKNYPKNSRCIWNITVPSGLIIKLTFANFILDSYGRDRVAVTNVASYDGPQPLHLYGQSLPYPVYSAGRSIRVIFTSLDNQFPGFNATYTAITYESVCPNMTTLNQTSGVITSPFYPRHYPSNQTCRWQITAETGSFKKGELKHDFI